MPKALTYYGCEFPGCHRRPLKARKRIADHESICWFNPANRTCVTCAFSRYQRAIIHGVMPDGSFATELGNYERECLRPEGSLIPEDLEKMGPHIRPVLKCHGWVDSEGFDFDARESLSRESSGGDL